VGAQGDVGQQLLPVYPVDREEHGLQGLDAALGHDGSAGDGQPEAEVGGGLSRDLARIWATLLAPKPAPSRRGVGTVLPLIPSAVLVSAGDMVDAAATATATATILAVVVAGHAPVAFT